MGRQTPGAHKALILLGLNASALEAEQKAGHLDWGTREGSLEAEALSWGR